MPINIVTWGLVIPNCSTVWDKNSSRYQGMDAKQPLNTYALLICDPGGEKSATFDNNACIMIMPAVERKGKSATFDNMIMPAVERIYEDHWHQSGS